MLRLAADTNTVVSALLWHGAPHRLFGAIQSEELSFYASRALLDELADVLPRRKLARAVQASGKSTSALVAEYQGLVQLVQPRALPRPVGRDPDDEAEVVHDARRGSRRDFALMRRHAHRAAAQSFPAFQRRGRVAHHGAAVAFSARGGLHRAPAPALVRPIFQ